MNAKSNFQCKKCVYCSSEKIFFVQLRKNKSTNKEVYYCEICERKFTPDDGFKKFRHPPFIIKTAMRSVKDNYSLGQITNSLNQNFGVKVSRKTILDWKRKFLNQGN